MSEVSNVLHKAAELLGERGWCKGELTNSDGEMCTVGAIYTAAGIYNSSLSSYSPYSTDEAVGLADASRDAVARHLFNRREYTGSELPSIPQWNDADERTAEDVILALKTTAAGLEGNA